MAARSSGPSGASLSPEDLAELRSALADGKTPTVYLREAIPGQDVPAGASGRVQSVDDAGTLWVKPRRIADVIAYEADELRMTKRAPAGAGPAKTQPAAGKQSVRKPAGASAGRSGSVGPAAGKPAPQTRPKPAARGSAEPRERSGSAQAAPPSGGSAEPRERAQAPAKSQRTKRGPASATVTIEGTADGSGNNAWTVTVAGGGTRAVKPVAVDAESVVRAVQELGVPRAVKAVDAVVVAAREQAERRVEELSRELAAAKKALRSLES